MSPPVPTVLHRLFEQHFQAPPTSEEPVAADASQRRMLRLQGANGETAVGVVGPDHDENRAFLSYTRTFLELGLPVPRLYAVDEQAGAWLEEDLGRTTLFDAVLTARAAGHQELPEPIVDLYRQVMRVLPRFQVEGGRAIDYGVAYPRADFDAQAMRWDLSYFKYHFLMLAHVPFHEDRLERDFARLVEFLLESDTDHFVYRDLQSRNIMVHEGRPAFLDYQGGRRGALQYDVASLLHDAKAGLGKALRDTLLDVYLEALADHLPVDRAHFAAHYRGYVLLRTLQALGTYGYRGFYERKPRFLKSVAPRVTDLEGLLASGFVDVDLPELRTVLGRVCASERLRPAPAADDGTLTVHVGSFSYKRGYPPDRGGHGGGMVFDCRGVENPGRDPAYARLSGRDAQVAAFLESVPAAAAFLAHAEALVDASVEVYRGRGFGSLDVHFGCTGGQHRSVYFAERLARHLEERFPDVRVDLVHAEAGAWPARVRTPGPTSA
jgi:aminoglycoside/choline kinase family phosphotransferase